MYVFVKFVCKNVFLNVCTTCTKIENVCILPRFLPFLFYLSRLETNNNLFSALQPVTGELTPVTTTQLKSYDDDEDQYKAAHAVDKDLSTVSVAETKNGETWLKLEFERNYFIHTITIYHQFYTNWYDPAHWCVQSYSNYQTCRGGPPQAIQGNSQIKRPKRVHFISCVKVDVVCCIKKSKQISV